MAYKVAWKSQIHDNKSLKVATISFFIWLIILYFLLVLLSHIHSQLLAYMHQENLCFYSHNFLFQIRVFRSFRSFFHSKYSIYSLVSERTFCWLKTFSPELSTLFDIRERIYLCKVTLIFPFFRALARVFFPIEWLVFWSFWFDTFPLRFQNFSCADRFSTLISSASSSISLYRIYSA